MKKYFSLICLLGFVLTPAISFAITYATLDPATAGSLTTLSNGNLTMTTSNATWMSAISTISKSSGKWYWEIHMDSNIVNGAMYCMADSTVNTNTFIGASNPAGRCIDSGSNQYYGSGYGGGNFSTGDVIGMAWDADAGTVEIFKNGLDQGPMYTGTFYGTQANVIFAGFSVQNGAQVTFDFGATPFAEVVPAGFCTAGLVDSCPVASSTTATTTPLTGSPTVDEWLLVACVIIYFISLWGWHTLFSIIFP